MTIILGDVPDELILNLSTGSPFSSSMQRTDGLIWDVDTSIELRVGSTVWPADIEGFEASLSLTASQVDTIIDIRRADLWYNGKLWATGQVVRNA